jgi:hypothetical protein
VQSPDAAGPEDRAHIYFHGRDLFSLGDKDGNRTIRSRSLPLIDRLNELWRLEPAPELTVDETNSNRAVIRAGGKSILEVLPGDAPGRDAPAEARRLRDLLTEALRARPERTR